MRERRVKGENTMTKQVVYMRMAVQAMVRVEKEECDCLGATSKCCADAIEDDEDDQAIRDERTSPGHCLYRASSASQVSVPAHHSPHRYRSSSHRH
jgi:hypothetical protein